MAEVGVFEAMYSQRSFTRFRPDPVPLEAIEKILEAATKAPSGGNSQPWEFVVIKDRDLIQRIGGIYREVWLGARGEGAPPDEAPAYRAARYLAQHIHEAPAMILVCADHTRGFMGYDPAQGIVRDRYASSIWLAVQNMFLAARALGLGTRLTTTHIRREQEIKDLLGIPDHVETMMLTPLGYPRGSFGAPDRRPVAEVTHFNRWSGRA